MALSTNELKTLVTRGVQAIVSAYDRGQITEDDLKAALKLYPVAFQAKYDEINNIINNRPNSEEQNEWSSIETIKDDFSQQGILVVKLKNYVKEWDSKRPLENHVDEARSMLFSIEEKRQWSDIEKLCNDQSEESELISSLRNYISYWTPILLSDNHVEEANTMLKKLLRNIEDSEWTRLNKKDLSALKEYLNKYPNSVHLDEIDAYFWEVVSFLPIILKDIDDYLICFPSGKYALEAQRVKNEYEVWDRISNSENIISVWNFIDRYETSPFIEEAKKIYKRLKSNVLEDLRKNKYDRAKYEEVKLLLDSHALNKNDLIEAKLITEVIYRDMFGGTAIKLPNAEPKVNPNVTSIDGFVDVYLLGIPSSGKTCVLMGLLGAHDLTFDHAGEYEEYGRNLVTYRTSGQTVRRTTGNFTARIDSTISREDSKGRNVKYNISLIEMAGEQFVFNMVFHPKKELKLDDMGSGASSIMGSDNNKIVFLVVDPNIEGNVELQSVDPQTGEKRSVTTQQETILESMIDILKANPKALSKTLAINFIMTKSDTIGEVGERDDLAVKRMQDKYHDAIIKVKELCDDYGINKGNDGIPKLYTFSLGQFCICDRFAFDRKDADKITTAITNLMPGKKKKTRWDKLVEKMND